MLALLVIHKHKKEKLMIKCMLLKTDKTSIYGGEELITAWCDQPDLYLWVDIESHDKEQERTLLQKLGCHLLAITDAQRDRHPPKIELFNDYIFMLYRGIYQPQDDLLFEHLQISMFVGTNILITSHSKQSMSIDHLFSADGEKFLRKSPITLALRIFHYSCGIYLQKLFEFEDKLEALEDEFQLGGDDKMM